MQLKTRDDLKKYLATPEPKAGELCSWCLEGIACTYNVKHFVGDENGNRSAKPVVVLPGAFSRAISMSSSDEAIGLCIEHESWLLATNEPLALPTYGELHLFERDGRLEYRAFLMKGPESRAIQRKVCLAELRGVSWGGKIVEQHDRGGYVEISEIRLVEISLCHEPANPKTSVDLVWPSRH